MHTKQIRKSTKLPTKKIGQSPDWEFIISGILFKNLNITIY